MGRRKTKVNVTFSMGNGVPNIVLKFFRQKAHTSSVKYYWYYQYCIDIFWYHWVSIRSSVIDTWYCQWNSDQKCKKTKQNTRSKMETTGKWGKCRRNLENSKFDSRNAWLTCRCECSWWRFLEGSLSIDTIEAFAKVIRHTTSPYWLNEKWKTGFEAHFPLYQRSYWAYWFQKQ